MLDSRYVGRDCNCFQLVKKQEANHKLSPFHCLCILPIIISFSTIQRRALFFSSNPFRYPPLVHNKSIWLTICDQWFHFCFLALVVQLKYNLLPTYTFFASLYPSGSGFEFLFSWQKSRNFWCALSIFLTFVNMVVDSFC